MGTLSLPDKERDATAIEKALNTMFKASKIEPWMDAVLVAMTVDGASVLLSALKGYLREMNKGCTTLFWYCAAHRTERIDADVAVVPKKD